MNAPGYFAPHAEPFFFDVDPGTRFCLYHPPAAHQAPRGAILYVHPFAEELGLSRRMATQQARLFASLGFAVLQIDLFGCGDSCGAFSAGRWEQWLRDLAVAAQWLRQRQAGPLYLWGLRLGALLAMDMAASCEVEGLILWQPLISGRTAIRHFLRSRLVARCRQPDPAISDLHGGTAQQEPAVAVRQLRAQLDACGRIDAGGFELDLAMVRSIEAHQAIELTLRTRTIYWFSNSPMPRRLAAHWQSAGIDLRYQQLPLMPFWTDAGRAECPALLGATTAALATAHDRLADGHHDGQPGPA